MRQQILRKANSALQQAAAVLALMREDMDKPGITRQRELVLHVALYDLEKRYSLLTDAYLDLIDSRPAHVSERWQRFLGHYLDFFEASRRHRRETFDACGPERTCDSPAAGPDTRADV